MIEREPKKPIEEEPKKPRGFVEAVEEAILRLENPVEEETGLDFSDDDLEEVNTDSDSNPEDNLTEE